MAQVTGGGKVIGQLWLYTLMRAAIFGVLFAILWLIDVRGLFGALIALVLSLPLSYVLLARPRAALARSLEDRAAFRKEREADLRQRLNGEQDVPAADSAEADGAGAENG